MHTWNRRAPLFLIRTSRVIRRFDTERSAGGSEQRQGLCGDDKIAMSSVTYEWIRVGSLVSIYRPSCINVQRASDVVNAHEVYACLSPRQNRAHPDHPDGLRTVRVSAPGTHPQHLGIHYDLSGLMDGEQLVNDLSWPFGPSKSRVSSPGRDHFLVRNNTNPGDRHPLRTFYQPWEVALSLAVKYKGHQTRSWA